MYLQFYGFKEAPFNLTPDSKFLFLSHRHQEALAALIFGVQERKGFICLTGEIGCGKTTLCRAMLSQLDPHQVKVCVVLNSYLTDLELLKTINEGFGLAAESDSKKALLDELNNFLIEEFSQGHNVVLVIDEAQNLRPETLEQIRMISNLETETAKLIQIVLIGQPELRRTLALPELEQLNQRITVRYHITPLDESDIPDYIKHRLAVAEPQVEVALSPHAYKLIYHFSRGVPRKVNVICDRCLLVGYVQGTFNMDDKIVQRAVSEVRGEVPGFDTAALTDAKDGYGAPAPRGKTLKWLAKAGQALGYLLVIMLVIAVSVYAGISYYNHRVSELEQQKQVAQAATRMESAKKSDVKFPIDAAEVVEVAKTGKKKAPATPTPAATPTPPPTPTPAPILYKNWEYDAENILRVRDADLCEVAAFINVMRRWNIDVDLDVFRNAPPKEVARYDMLEMVKGLKFQAVEADTLADALRYDLPVLVRQQDQKGVALYGVITSMRGEVLEYIDPIRGKQMIQRKKLEPLVTKTTVLFRDKMDLAGLEPGTSDERVTRLQAWLAQESLFDGEPDGKYGDKTREAVEKLQKREGLKETGRIDALTAAAISAKTNPRRPRLYS